MDKIKCIKCGNKAAVIALFTNIFLTLFKGYIGMISHSRAVMADAFHSSADIVNSMVIIISMKLGSKPPDESHPYGHGKIEFIASIIAASVLLVGACLMILAGVRCLSMGIEKSPGIIAAAAAAVSIMVNVLVSTYTFCPGKKLNSLPLITSAWDNRTDAYSSVVVLVGVVGAKIGFPALDPMAAVLIALVIIKAQVGIILEGLKGLIDASMDKKEIRKLIKITGSIKEVEKICSIKSRRMGQKFWVDMKVFVGAEHSLRRGKEIASAIEKIVKNNMGCIEKVQVLVEPVS